ncbi:gamma-glutamyltransferase [Actinocatenispora thailandica]|uniref:gamma-glutamyltransferase n=1 Tax=Actinocatenispora thailandica TaxID=227318 RepID=UPI001EF32E2F|nr:gamma-glutamyltransferase [Actinocatenispora thailandica]
MEATPAGIAAGHPATAQAGLSILAAGGSAADAAIAAVLAACAAETVLTGLAGGGFATYYDAASRTVTCLDFFVAVPGLDGDVTTPTPMTPVSITLGTVPIPYEIGAASVAVPGVPAGCGALHSRWGRLPWSSVLAPAVELARRGAELPAAQAHTLRALAPAMLPADGAQAYAPRGRLLEGGEVLRHPGLDKAMAILRDDGPEAFYTGAVGRAMIDTVRAGGGTLGPADLAEYRVLELPVGHAGFAGAHVYGRPDDLNHTIDTLAALDDAVLGTDRTRRAVLLADALRDHALQRLGDTTNISVIDPDGNACVVTTTLGLGAAVWLPGLGVHLNSMLGEGELIIGALPPGARMNSMMCPLVVTATEAGRAHTGAAAEVPTGTGDDVAGTQPGAGLPDDTRVEVSTVVGPEHPAAHESVTELGDVTAPIPGTSPPGPGTGTGPAPGSGPGRGGPGSAEPVGPHGDLLLAVGAAGASRIRTALAHTLLGVLVDGLDPETAIGRARFHIVTDTAHAEPGVPDDELAALVDAGYQIHQWPDLDHYFGGASAVGRTGAGGDPRRGGIGMHL